jgi:hypothetical protein
MGSDHIRVVQLMAIGVKDRAEWPIPVMNAWRSNECDALVTQTSAVRRSAGGMNM